jgi:hypothetical protein
MNKIKYILIVIFLLFITGDSYKKNIIRPHQIDIINKTTYVDVCYMSYILSYEIFEIDTLKLLIYPSTDNSFYGMVNPLPFGEHKYLLLLKTGLSDEMLKETLSHEFIHINQFETGRLESFGNWFVWEKDTILGEEVFYNDRPFEIEAYNNQDKIVKELNRNYNFLK